MAASVLQSSGDILRISVDAGTTRKAVTCLKSHAFNLESAITKEETLACGTFSALGSPTWGFDFDGVVNLTPTGASELSYEDLLALANAQTLVFASDVYPDPTTGTDFHHTGNAYITSLRKTAAVGALVAFSGRLEGQGLLDIAP